ncbi:hypothetical protein [Nocardia sp. BMG111209]|uniref:hypothetical protein n=1 Tax=Nocardia sp. BMG111209 TaxID=1160137 RepID=UPI0003736D2B|nr:hypothetical protein [Nocardia sp. BMG111209]
MVSLRPPTRAELIENFEAELASAAAGSGIHSESGLDMETEAALVVIARAYPDVKTQLITAARSAFAGQLDGSNTVARTERIRRLLAEKRDRG